MEYQTPSYTIDQLILRIRTGRLALPDFQRDFVWNGSKVVDLLDSVAKQWPIGSLLLLSGPQTFAIRSVDSGPVIVGEKLDMYILDGQQRLTALYHAVMDVSDQCYYIDFNALVGDESEYIKWEKRSRFLAAYGSVSSRAKAGIALIKDVWDLEAFYAWLEALPNASQRSAYVGARERQLTGLQSKVYKIMAIELDQEIELEALARIFETLNRTGVKLNAFDLMVASLYPSGFRLRDEWEIACAENAVLRELAVDANEMLKLTSLLIRVREGRAASKGVRQGDLLSINKLLISGYWPDAVKSYVFALEFCKREFGVVSEETLASPSMILAVAVWLKVRPLDIESLKNWWADKILTQHFSQAANTRIISDVDQICNTVNLKYGQSGYIGYEIFNQAARRNGVLQRGFAGLMIAGGAKDPLTNEPLKYAKGIGFLALQDDGSLRKLGNNDSLLTMVLCSTDTETFLSRRSNFASIANAETLMSQGFVGLKRSQEFLAETFKGLAAIND